MIAKRNSLDKMVERSRIGNASLLARKAKFIPAKRSFVGLSIVLIRQIVEKHIRIHNFDISLKLKVRLDIFFVTYEILKSNITCISKTEKTYVNIWWKTFASVKKVSFLRTRSVGCPLRIQLTGTHHQRESFLKKVWTLLNK